jgi:hypothetical protein
MTREMFLQSAVLVVREGFEGQEGRIRKQEEALILGLRTETAHATCQPQDACLDAPDAVRYQKPTSSPFASPLFTPISRPPLSVP